MKDLSPDARAVLDAVRDAHAPSESDRDRVRKALARRLAAPAAAALSARAALAPAKAFVAKVAIAKTLVGLVIAGSVAASVYAVTHPPAPHQGSSGESEHAIEVRPEARTSHLVASQPAAPLPSVPIVNEPSPAPIAAPATLHVRTTTSIRSRPPTPASPSAVIPIETPEPERPSSTNTLGAELALVRGAQDALRDHDAAAALTLLDRHATEFPFGVLREERSAARVLALCALDRIDAAREEAARLLRSAPSSPQVARVRASCAGEHADSAP